MSITQEQAIRLSSMEGFDPDKDRAKIWREAQHDGLECLHARFTRHAYAPHVHDTYVVGVILDGAELFRAYGVSNVGLPGHVTALNPDVLHDGAPGEAGYRYRTAYPSADLMQTISEEIQDRPAGLPFFRYPLYNDPELAVMIEQMHKLFEIGAPRLQADAALVRTLGVLIARHADDKPLVRPIGRERGLVAKVCRLLEDRLDEDLGLQELAQDLNVSRFHLIRAFKSELGVTPHAFRTSVRIQKARGLLRGGADLADTAVACGFYDQSHFNKAFKGVVGVTPGSYRTALAA
ncbi:helix-turn-helix domain-containing protein [Hwanghaeella sp.]|uniref:helix-turn-helix domain-containing protein n=1 Tax=Hwanghaeella sp. TaxID=2605943 RepID=UPI003CCBC6D6